MREGVHIVSGECPLPERIPLERFEFLGMDISYLNLPKIDPNDNVVITSPRRLYCPLSAFALNLDCSPDWEGEGSITPLEINCQFIGNNPIEFTFLECRDRKDFPWLINYVIAYPCKIPRQVLSILERRASPEYLAHRTPIYIMGLNPRTFSITQKEAAAITKRREQDIREALEVIY
jgi:hypothetical protein